MNRQSSHVKKIQAIIFLLFACISTFSQTSQLKAVNDTIDLYPGVPLVYDILANDTIPAGDTVKYITVSGGGHVQITKSHDPAWNWTFTFLVPTWGFGGEVTGKYTLRTVPFDTSSATILYRIHDKSYSYLDINNVSARFSSSGNHFFGENAEFEVPKGSGKTSVFSNALWIGGKDVAGNLHFAGERYRQGPTSGQAGTKPDFYSGPVMDSASYSIYQDTVWNYIWNLKKSEIDYHRAHYWEPGYTPVHDILTWPAHGNPALGQAPHLAPFSDRNGNGIYEPYDGDYPEIRGDQALFFIFNDDRGPHLESMGAKLRVEIHGMAYAFDMPNDSALKNTVFLYYKIFNRSQNTYDSTLFGVFTDIDLGYANDDFTGCDVERGMYFGYNGTPVDGTGQSYAYGANPPTQSVTLLAGPLMDPDGIDNPRYSNTGVQLCDFSVNGLCFGDTIVDNERMGLQKFLYFNNSNSGVPSYMNDPDYAPEYYKLMQGRWKDGSQMIYGGNGHSLAGGYGPACRFMFPGESDTLNWGVGCAPPNGPVNWTEETALNNPQDRRGIGITGPVTFTPGDVQELDIAFTWARDYTGKTPLSSLAKLRMMTDIIMHSFATNKLPNGNQFYGLNDQNGPATTPVNIYPNPASGSLTIEFTGKVLPAGTIIEVITMEGNCLDRIVTKGFQQSVVADLSGLPSGLYFIGVTTADSRVVKKVMVIH